MKYVVYSLILFLLYSCEEQHTTQATVAFYNVENLFDTKDDPTKYDEQYTPSSDRKWDREKYNTKLTNLAKVISQLADNEAPTFLGVCEIENKSVLEDLVKDPKISNNNYGIAHIESPDERGIDVAFLYKKAAFKVKNIKATQPDLSAYNDKTRDILHVTGTATNGETLHFIINHWPSRGEGRSKSEPKRIQAAKALNKITTEIYASEENPKIFVLGDFNDEPSNKSITKTVNVSCKESTTSEKQLYNAFCNLENEDKGSYRYRKYWDMLDQIMVSKALLTDTAGLHYIPNSAAIKAEPWMIQTGKYEGFPLRTYGGKNYLGGYSDHFPVSIKLEY